MSLLNIIFMKVVLTGSGIEMSIDRVILTGSGIEM